ncbi:hypothetical protein F2Q69_00050622 [Brassica cretica]|uniref:Uncharacterized protein n=1 Tax=Brassica cretica TaxID=69181 RepID=A0A8S9Q6S1_BRACR|nr:hypothetical protein F2Q69_00050622 [Brassica cretica]
MRVGDGDGKALATQTTSLKGTDHETIRRSDIDALIKALKDNGNSFGNTLGHSLAAYRSFFKTLKLSLPTRTPPQLHLLDLRSSPAGAPHRAVRGPPCSLLSKRWLDDGSYSVRSASVSWRALSACCGLVCSSFISCSQDECVGCLVSERWLDDGSYSVRSASVSWRALFAFLSLAVKMSVLVAWFLYLAPNAASASSSRSEVFSGRRSSPCCLSDMVVLWVLERWLDDGSYSVRSASVSWRALFACCGLVCSSFISCSQDECVGCLVSVLSWFRCGVFIVWVWFGSLSSKASEVSQFFIPATTPHLQFLVDSYEFLSALFESQLPRRVCHQRLRLRRAVNFPFFVFRQNFSVPYRNTLISLGFRPQMSEASRRSRVTITLGRSGQRSFFKTLKLSLPTRTPPQLHLLDLRSSPAGAPHRAVRGPPCSLLSKRWLDDGSYSVRSASVSWRALSACCGLVCSSFISCSQDECVGCLVSAGSDVGSSLFGFGLAVFQARHQRYLGSSFQSQHLIFSS